MSIEDYEFDLEDDSLSWSANSLNCFTKKDSILVKDKGNVKHNDLVSFRSLENKNLFWKDVNFAFFHEPSKDDESSNDIEETPDWFRIKKSSSSHLGSVLQISGVVEPKRLQKFNPNQRKISSFIILSELIGSRY